MPLIELLFLLLPVAAASGWWAARRDPPRPAKVAVRKDPASFLRGLNYLLDEQPDKAIDVFLKLAEVDQETVETHLALGSLFRRRGEVERAIRVHQNLVARSNLDPEQRGFALYELGQDYRRAGLLDRAESLFRELLELKLQRRRALMALAEIYQQEKDWARALEVAEELRRAGVAPMRTEMAQFHCELAVKALCAGMIQDAVDRLDQAQACDAGCVRAVMLRADIALEQGEVGLAIEQYREAVRQDPRYVPEILPKLAVCFRGEQSRSWSSELADLCRLEPSPPLVLELVEAIRREQGDEAAIATLTAHLEQRADLAALARLLELQMARFPDALTSSVAVGLAVVRHMLAQQPGYRCEHCGFTARRIHWQCPSCKRWSTVRPVLPEPLIKSGALS